MGDNYQSQINNLLDNQKYLMSGVNTVYPSFSLDSLITDTRKSEYNGIKDYDAKLQNVNIQTRLNLAKLYNEQNEVLSANQKLIVNNRDIYDSDFNDNIEKINKINNVISTKNKIIQINEYEQSKKDRIIFIMKKKDMNASSAIATFKEFKISSADGVEECAVVTARASDVRECAIDDFGIDGNAGIARSRT